MFTTRELWSPFEEFFQAPTSWMRADVRNLKDKIRVEVDIPGVQEKDIKVEFHNGVLSLAATRTKDAENAVIQERHHGVATRSFRLGENLDTERITAKYSNGVLYVEIPKMDKIMPRQIPILSQ